MSEDNSGRDKQIQSVEQADSDQAAYLDSLIAQFQDDADMDLANNADLSKSSDYDDDEYYDDDHELIEPVLSDAILTETNTSPSHTTTPAGTGKPEPTTDPTIILLAGFVFAILLSTAIWLALHVGNDKHAVTETGQSASQSAPAQTTAQPVAPATMDQQMAPAPITATENNEPQSTTPEQSEEEPVVSPDQIEEQAAAPELSEEPADAAEQVEEQAAEPEQAGEPAAVTAQSEPTPTAEQQQAQTPTQAAPSPATMLHLEIDPVSRKVIAPQPANTRMVWAVNLTSVSTVAIAENIRANLNHRGVATELVLVTIGDQTYYRIRIPGFASKRAARRALRAYMKEREFSGAWIENYHPRPRTSE